MEINFPVFKEIAVSNYSIQMVGVAIHPPPWARMGMGMTM
jgi:hypothetical protein